MDPTADELSAMNTLEEVRNWAGVADPIAAPLADALGDPARIREVALITRARWEAAVTSLRIGDGGRELTPVEHARIESYRRICLLRVGKNPEDQSGAPQLQPGVVSQPLPATGVGGPPSRRLKLAAVLDPTLDAEVVPIPQNELVAMYRDYSAKFGDQPGPDYDPTPDQIAALAQVSQAGAVPYADFSIFGPFGHRRLRKQAFTSYTLNAATGEWSKKEQPGPPGFHDWYQTGKTYRCTMLLLGLCDAERLDSYSEHIRNFVTQFGEETWFLIYRADVRMRSEQLERIRRALRENPAHGYTEANPWGACFTAATKDSDFWTRELVTSATLWLSGNKQRSQGREAEQALETPVKRKTRAKRKYSGDDRSQKGSDGLYVLNRKGIEICRAFGEGKCGSEKAQGKCKNGRSHQCSRCLGPHPLHKCDKK